MNREQQEMTVWRCEFELRRGEGLDIVEAASNADEAAAEFRKRYPAEPAAKTVWYDEPPFPKDGKSYPCWVDGCAVHGDVYWLETEWRVWIVGSALDYPIAGRRVCPIVKPQEPTT